MKIIFFCDVKVVYQIEGKGFLVVLIYGFCSDNCIWEDFKQDFLEENYKVVMIDLFGFGVFDVVQLVSI